MSFSFPPKGWALCKLGRVLSIAAEPGAVLALLGTTYGGNGQTTFMLPDLRGRAPLHASDALPLGTRAGQEAVTLSTRPDTRPHPPAGCHQ